MRPQVPNVDGLIEEGKKAPKKNWDITLHSVWGRGEVTRLQPEVYTPAGAAGQRCVAGWEWRRCAVCNSQCPSKTGHAVTAWPVQQAHQPSASASLLPPHRRARLLHPRAQVTGGQGGQGSQEAGGAGAGGGGGG